MSIRVADVAADLGFVLLRGGEEFRPSRAAFVVHGADVGASDVEEAARAIAVWRDLEGDGWLVVGRASAAIDDDPAVGKGDIGGFSWRDSLTAEHLGVERCLDGGAVEIPEGADERSSTNDKRNQAQLWYVICV